MPKLFSQLEFNQGTKHMVWKCKVSFIGNFNFYMTASDFLLLSLTSCRIYHPIRPPYHHRAASLEDLVYMQSAPKNMVPVTDNYLLL